MQIIERELKNLFCIQGIWMLHLMFSEAKEQMNAVKMRMGETITSLSWRICPVQVPIPLFRHGASLSHGMNALCGVLRP